jgi:gluconate kinase
LVDQRGVQLTDDERLVWLAAFGTAVAKREDRAGALELADLAVEYLRDARAYDRPGR